MPRPVRLNPRRAIACALGIAGLALVSGAALAQTQAAGAWPQRPIRVVVPFPPGNASDLMARGVSERMTQRLGQPVVVENRAGASGIIGVETVTKSAPDGYTLLLSTISPVTLNPMIYKKLPYDVERDLIPVVNMGYTPFMLVSHPSVPARTLQEVVEWVRANPGKVTYASIGQGTMSQLLMEMFSRAVGLEMIHVPYKGSGQALNDMIGGQTQLMFDGMTSSNVQVRAGKLRGYAVSSLKRASTQPGLPTLTETKVKGLEDFEVVGWMGFFAPAGTPRAIVERINAEASLALEAPEVRERLASQSVEIYEKNTPEQFDAFFRKELARWRQVGTAIGVAGSQ
jgi:tripartite-type tricarboxylate transporter receptor subunit TctC